MSMLRLEISLHCQNQDEAEEEAGQLVGAFAHVGQCLGYLGPTYRYSTGCYDVAYDVQCSHGNHDARRELLNTCDDADLYVRSCDWV